LKLQYDEVLSSFAFNFKLRRYTVGDTQMMVGFAISALMQLGNLHCHVYQSSLRADGSKVYKARPSQSRSPRHPTRYTSWVHNARHVIPYSAFHILSE